MSQNGNNNSSTSFQDNFFGNPGNTSTVSQDGNDNGSNMTQLGDDNLSSVDQDGNDNDSVVLQEGDENISDVKQDGNNNSSDVDQWGDRNNSDVDQLGDNNTATLDQGYFGADNTSTVLQDGDGNSSDTFQDNFYGNPGNMSTVDQIGNDNVSIVSQLGDNNQLVIKQNVLKKLSKKAKVKSKLKKVSDQDDSKKDGVEIVGIVVEDTLTKLGRDFYSIFNNLYVFNEINGSEVVKIKEVFALGRNTKMEVYVGEKKVFNFFMKPQKEYLTKMGDYALIRVFKHFQSLKRLEQMIEQY